MNSYNPNQGANQAASTQADADQGSTRHFPRVEGGNSQLPQAPGPMESQTVPYTPYAQPQGVQVEQQAVPTYNQSQLQQPQAPQYQQPPQGNGAPVYSNYGQPGVTTSQQAQAYPAAGDHRRRDRTMLGIILIGGGLLFGLTEFSVIPGFGHLVLLLVGAIFMYAYFQTRPGYRVGFLIPGAILLGIGAGDLLSSLAFVSFWRGGDITAFTLGLGFCLIWAFERRHWWALIPGGILVLSSLSSVWMIGNLWPLALIMLGAYLLIDQSRRKQMR